MSKSKKKHGSAFAVLFVILLLLSVAFTVCANVIFSGDRVPMIAGYYLYLHEKSDMEPDIPANSLVIAKSAEQESLQAGAKVLCYLADGNMALRCIYNIDVNEDGTSLYYPGTALEQGNELTIERKNIFAVCIWASKEMYTIIQFATSVVGLMSMLVAPCIILIIMLLVKIAKSSRDDDERRTRITYSRTTTITRRRLLAAASVLRVRCLTRSRQAWRMTALKRRRLLSRRTSLRSL